MVRVLVESGDGEKRWSTVGVSDNIVEASWKALVDSIDYKILKGRAQGPGLTPRPFRAPSFYHGPEMLAVSFPGEPHLLLSFLKR